jgi:hypothetical protein
MNMKKTIQTVATVSMPALAVGLLLGLLMLVSPLSTRQLQAQGDAVRIGQLRLADNESGNMGDFILELEQMAAPPAGEHYELWMQSDAGELLRLGEFEVGDGNVTFAGSTEVSLLRDYSSVLISLEPDNEPDEETLSQVVLSSTLPSELLTLARQLLVSSEADAPALFDNLQAQIAVASQQNDFLADALVTEDYAEVRRRAEQIINVLDGESGTFFGDLDRDGQTQNPGDGVGVRGYIEQAHDIVLDILSTLTTTEELRTQAQQVATMLEESQHIVEEARDQAQKVFAADTKTESEIITQDIDALFAELMDALTDAHSTALDLAAYPFYSTTALPSAQIEAEQVHIGQLRLAYKLLRGSCRLRV